MTNASGIVQAVLKHLPGKHSQLSHGHGEYGGVPVPSSRYGVYAKTFVMQGRRKFLDAVAKLGTSDPTDDQVKLALSAMHTGDGKIKTYPVDLAPDTVRRLKGAQTWLANTVAGTRPGANQVDVAHSQKEGSYHDDEVDIDVIFLSETATEKKYADENLVHEYGHWLSTGNEPVLRAASEFLRARTPDKLILRKDERGDVIWADKFVSSYLGKEYCGTDKGRLKTTEIVSGALEHLYKDPVGLYRYDPDMFFFILGVVGHA